MADTTDRTVIHYMIRTQHPQRADCWLIEFLAPASAHKFAVTKEEWQKFVQVGAGKEDPGSRRQPTQVDAARGNLHGA